MAWFTKTACPEATSYTRINSIEYCFDKGLIAGGVTGFTSGQELGFVMKTDSTGHIAPIGIINSHEIMPQDYVLLPNYPNPFNSTTLVKMQIRKKARVSLDIFDLTGRRIKNLIDRILGPGLFEVFFNAEEMKLASGVYFLKLDAYPKMSEVISQSLKIIIVK